MKNLRINKHVPDKPLLHHHDLYEVRLVLQLDCQDSFVRYIEPEDIDDFLRCAEFLLSNSDYHAAPHFDKFFHVGGHCQWPLNDENQHCELVGMITAYWDSYGAYHTAVMSWDDGSPQLDSYVRPKLLDSELTKETA